MAIYTINCSSIIFRYLHRCSCVRKENLLDSATCKTQNKVSLSRAKIFVWNQKWQSNFQNMIFMLEFCAFLIIFLKWYFFTKDIQSAHHTNIYESMKIIHYFIALDLLPQTKLTLKRLKRGRLNYEGLIVRESLSSKCPIWPDFPKSTLDIPWLTNTPYISSLFACSPPNALS